MILVAVELCMNNEKKNHFLTFPAIKDNFLCMDNSNAAKL